MGNEKCKKCGGTQMDDVDGFIFCSSCGQQCEGVIEKDADVFGSRVGAKLSQSATKSQDMKKKMYQDKLKNIADSSQQFASLSQSMGIELDTDLLHEQLLQSMKTDDMKTLEETEKRRTQVADSNEQQIHEEHANQRVMAFSKLLLDLVQQVIRKLRLPAAIKDVSLRIFLIYLQKNGIFLEEVGMNADGVKPIFLDCTHEVGRLAKHPNTADVEQHIPNRLRHMKLLKIKLNQMTNENGKLDEMMLPHADRCNLIHLSLNLCVWITYASILMVGERAITLSDFLRWFRQGVIRLDVAAFYALELRYTSGGGSKSRRWTHFVPRSAVTGRTWKPGILFPLDYNYGHLMIFLNYVEILKEPVAMDFPRLVLRTLKNLNLPRCFMTRIQKLCEICPPQSVLFHPNEVLFSYKNWCKDDMYWIKNVTQVFAWHDRKCVRQPVENEVMQYILLSLVLMFGLDNFSENKMSQAARDYDKTRHDGGMCFDFGQWVIQLKMRVSVLLGEDVKSVLSKKWTSFVDDAWQGAVVHRIYLRNQVELLQYSNAPLPLFTPLNVPNFQEQEHNDNVENSDLFLFCPLQYVAEKHQNVKGELDNPIFDQQNVQLFFQDFHETDMHFVEHSTGEEEFWKELYENYYGEDKQREMEHLMQLYWRKGATIEQIQGPNKLIRFRGIQLYSYRHSELKFGRCIQKMYDRKARHIEQLAENVRTRYFAAQNEQDLNENVLETNDWKSSGSESEWHTSSDSDDYVDRYEVIQKDKMTKRPKGASHRFGEISVDLMRSQGVTVGSEMMTPEMKLFPCSRWMPIPSDIFEIAKKQRHPFLSFEFGARDKALLPFQVRPTPNNFELVAKILSMSVGSPFHFMYVSYFLLQIRAFNLLGDFLPVRKRLCTNMRSMLTHTKCLSTCKRKLLYKYRIPANQRWAMQSLPAKKWERLLTKAARIRKCIDKMLPPNLSEDERKKLLLGLLNTDYPIIYGRRKDKNSLQENET